MALHENITVCQNATYRKTYPFENADGTPADLSEYTPKAQVRDHKGSLIATLNVAVSGSNVLLAITDEESLAMPEGKYAYDIFLEHLGGEKRKFYYGTFRVEPSATQI